MLVRLFSSLVFCLSAVLVPLIADTSSPMEVVKSEQEEYFSYTWSQNEEGVECIVKAIQGSFFHHDYEIRVTQESDEPWCVTAHFSFHPAAILRGRCVTKLDVLAGHPPGLQPESAIRTLLRVSEEDRGIIWIDKRLTRVPVVIASEQKLDLLAAPKVVFMTQEGFESQTEASTVKVFFPYLIK